MKKSKFTLVVLLIVLPFVFINCKKDDATVEESGKMKAKIDNVDWRTGDVSFAISLDGMLNITGMSDSNELISITLQSVETGTYTLNNTTLNVATYTEDQSGSSAYTTLGSAEAGGEVIVTEITESTVSGTFAFKAIRLISLEEKNITEGTFNKIDFTPAKK